MFFMAMQLARFLVSLVVAVVAVLCLVGTADAALQNGNYFPAGMRLGRGLLEDSEVSCTEETGGTMRYQEDEVSAGRVEVCGPSDSQYAWKSVSNSQSELNSIYETLVDMQSKLDTLLSRPLGRDSAQELQDDIFCSGHGVFVPGASDLAGDHCECHYDATNGFHLGPRCQFCEEGMGTDELGRCNVDVELPEISLLGDNPLTHEGATPYTDPGATASDNLDGDLSSSVVINATDVNVAVVGTYTVIFTVVDSTGNEGTAERTVLVVDTTPPVVTISGPSLITQEAGEPFSAPSASATDSVDGDLTSLIVVSPTPTSTLTALGNTVFTYSATDLSGNEDSDSVVVEVVDTLAPQIVLTGASVLTIEAGENAYVEPGYSASDVRDGDLTSVVSVTTFDPQEVGTYTVQYSVNDAAGHPASVTRTVHVVDTTHPTIQLNSFPSTFEQYSSIDLAYLETDSAVAHDNAKWTPSDVLLSPSLDARVVSDGDEYYVSVSHSIDSAVVGVYNVTYSFTDGEGLSASAFRLVEITPVNECLPGGLFESTCSEHSSCTDTTVSFTCACNSGWNGDGFTCSNIDECGTGSHSCHQDATCTDTQGSYECACNVGYDGDGLICGDIDECTTGTHDCDDNADCTNTVGSFTCACSTGYSGNGDVCIGDIYPTSDLVYVVDASNGTSASGSSSVWRDLSGNGNDFIFDPSALKMDASTGVKYMDFGGDHGAALSSTGFDVDFGYGTGDASATLVAWVRVLTTSSDGSGWRTLYRGRDDQGADHKIIIQTGSNNIGFYNNHNNLDGSSRTTSLITSGFTYDQVPFASDQWQMWTLVFAPSAPYWRLYINDAQVASISDNGAAFQSGIVTIGGHYSDLFSPNPANQYFGDVAFSAGYRRSFSAGEVADFFHATKYRYGLSPSAMPNLLLHLDASLGDSYPGSGDRWTDLSPNGNDFRVVPSTFRPKAGSGGHFEFIANTSRKYDLVPSWNVDFGFGLNDVQGTVSAWGRPQTSTAQWRTLFRGADDGSVDIDRFGDHQFIIHEGGSEIGFYNNRGEGDGYPATYNTPGGFQGTGYHITSVSSYSTTWHLYTYVFSTTSPYLKLYINGVHVASSTSTGARMQGGIHAIGGHFSRLSDTSLSPSQPFGDVGSVYMFNRTFSDREVYALYLATLDARDRF